MHATARAGIPWMPTTEAERLAILRLMDRLLNSRHFRNSKRYPALLEYLVRETLAGNSDLLKERLLGIAVFHRPADYDANADPVVRVTAAEIRKRIAQFYQDEGQAEEIRIDLHPGSYVPEFYPITSSENKNHQPIGIPVEAESPATDTRISTALGVWSRWRFPAIALASGLFVAVALVALVWHWRVQDDQQSQIWSPLLNSAAPVLVVIGQPHASQLEIHPPGSVYELNAATELNLPDAIAMAHICNTLDANHHLYQITAVSSTSLSDLRKGPAILVGGFNNPWTLRILSPLRFSLKSIGDSSSSPQVLQIVDRNGQLGSPWTFNLQQPISAMTHDYAIIARFQASMTDGEVMVVAGLGAGGTESASKFVSSSAFMKQLAASAPHNWRNMNMEAVLETEVIGGRTGHTRIIATEFW
jgi:hypothetical protein